MQMQRQTRAPSSSGCAHANDGLAQSWPGRRLRGLSRAQPGLSGTAGPGVSSARCPGSCEPLGAMDALLRAQRGSPGAALPAQPQRWSAAAAVQTLSTAAKVLFCQRGLSPLALPKQSALLAAGLGMCDGSAHSAQHRAGTSTGQSLLPDHRGDPCRGQGVEDVPSSKITGVLPAGDRESRLFPVPKSLWCSSWGQGDEIVPSSQGTVVFPDEDRDSRLFPVPKSLLDSLVGTGR